MLDTLPYFDPGADARPPACREYNVALRTELKRKEMKDDPKRTAELAAYFTHAKLQPVHQARTNTCPASLLSLAVHPLFLSLSAHVLSSHHCSR